MKKYDVQSAAVGYIKQLSKLETNILLVYWDAILQRLNASSKILQDIETDVITVQNLYESLIGYAETQSKDFSIFEQQAKDICDEENYEDNYKRIKRAKLFYDDTQNSTTLSGRDRFKIRVFDFINSSILTELKKTIKILQ
jgi:hypothetical protein